MQCRALLGCAMQCPLSGVKRTSKFKSVTSAFDPKRTFAQLQLTLPVRRLVNLHLINAPKEKGEYH